MMISQKAHQRRRLLRRIVQGLERLLLRTQVRGQEHLPQQGPVIFVANHASTLDPLLMISHLPAQVYPVGPGDFKLLFPGNLVVESLGVILIQRGAADRDSLKQMAQVLKAGQMLALFPEGGTWEKRLDDVKPGAAYLSMTAGAPIVPIAIGGTYQVWAKVLRLQRPQVSFTILPPLPPLPAAERHQRAAALHRASLGMMQAIYDHLPPEEQARYDLHARQRFWGQVESLPTLGQQPAPLPDFAVLAELISKPNLFSPLHRNLGLPLEPFLQRGRFFPSARVCRALKAMQEAFSGPYAAFIPYRLGEAKAAQLLRELDALTHLAGQVDYLRFSPQVELLPHPLAPNQ